MLKSQLSNYSHPNNLIRKTCHNIRPNLPPPRHLIVKVAILTHKDKAISKI